MNRTAFKIAASATIISITMVACSSQSDAMRRLGDVARASAPTDRQAAQLRTQASAALNAGELSRAIDLMEQAVALSPRDVGYRLLLADAYLKNGRLDSARATYSDVIELDPSNVRAGLSVALLQIAQGRPAAAVARLDDLAGNAPVADVGLAYALAGQNARAVEMLESAARSPSATPRTRQNLALAYALSGDWRRARSIAAQDVSPGEIDARMAQWAAFARPGAAATQVAGLLGVTPVRDAGQPVRLALAPNRPAEAFAAAAVPESRAEFAAPAPVEVAAAEAPAEAPAFYVPTAQSYAPAPEAEAPAPVPAPAPAPAPVRVASAEAAYQVEEDGPAPAAPVLPQREAPAHYAAAARALVQPRRELIRAAAVAPPAFQRARPVVRSGNAPVVVQLGAFSNEANAERAWVQASGRYHLQGRRPLTTTIDVNGRTMHRVSVSGFASTADAQRLCGSIKAQGGVCFVRNQAGDASIRWAARYAPGRNRNV